MCAPVKLLKRVFARHSKTPAPTPPPPPAAPVVPLTTEDRDLIERLLKSKGLFISPEGAAEFRTQREKELQKYKEAENDVMPMVDLVKKDKPAFVTDDDTRKRTTTVLRVLKEAQQLKAEGNFVGALAKLEKEIPEGLLKNQAWFLEVARRAREKREAIEAKEKKRKANLSKDGDAKDLQTHFPNASISIDEGPNWAELLGSSPLGVCQEMLKGLPLDDLDSSHYEMQFLKIGENEFSLTLNLKPSAAEKFDRMTNLMSLQRTISIKDGKKSMKDMRTDVHMDKGGCKKLYKNLLPLYQKLGVEEVTMDADEVGSYAWVRYGFRPSNREEWSELRKKIRARAETIDPPLPDQVRRSLEQILLSDDPDRIVAIADLQEGKRKIGFELLSKNMWKGTLNLKDPEILQAVNLYINQE